jgi:hypothetical protein
MKLSECIFIRDFKSVIECSSYKNSFVYVLYDGMLNLIPEYCSMIDLTVHY